MVFEDVKSYIDESVFHSDTFDALTEAKKAKAVKNAEKVLYLIYKTYKPDENPLPVEAIAYQTLWIIAKDASIRKAEMGVASQSIEGMTQSFSEMDRTVAPEVKRILKKRVGSYTVRVANTNRWEYFR